MASRRRRAVSRVPENRQFGIKGNKLHAPWGERGITRYMLRIDVCLVFVICCQSPYYVCVQYYDRMPLNILKVKKPGKRIKITIRELNFLR